MSSSPNRLLGIIFGVIYLVVGVFGFFLTSATAFLGTSGPLFIGLFQVNPLQNLGHVVAGAALLIAGLAGARGARVINGLLGAVFLVLGIIGLVVAGGNNPLNIFAFNGADNVLHFATAVVLLAVSIGADKSPKKA
ncbi:MAG TPA: DUF4383 domain-containing protein [Galbitalea sp.]|jgi:hypothetical protein